MAMYLSYVKGSILDTNSQAYSDGYNDGYAQGAADKPVGPTIVTWAGGTDEQIITMVQAADNGTIDLTEYWSVGDERTFSMSAITTHPTGINETHVAQNLIMTIVALDNGVHNNSNPCWNYPYVTPTTGRTYPSFIIHMKKALNTAGIIDSTTSTISSRGWDGSARRTWCNDDFKNACDSTLLSLIKQVVVKSANTYDASELTTSSDYFFMPTIKEVFYGSSRYINCGSNAVEWNYFPVWDYYYIATNRKKSRNNNTSYISWWTRSLNTYNQQYLCYINTSGTDAYQYSNGNNYLVMAACI